MNSVFKWLYGLASAAIGAAREASGRKAISSQQDRREVWDTQGSGRGEGVSQWHKMRRFKNGGFTSESLVQCKNFNPSY